MRVLFVCSGNKHGKPGAVVQNQAESLINVGIQIDFYLIRGQGILGYLKNVYPLFKYLKKTDFDVIHSHYSLSAIVSSLALLFSRSKPHVVSLMGSDTQLVFIYRLLVKFFNRFLWNRTIVKSPAMQKFIGLKDCLVIPNGVDIAIVEVIKQGLIKKDYEDTQAFGNILFAADPLRMPKNFPLAERAMEQISGRLNVIYNKPHKEIIEAILTTDILLLTSHSEGSPNIIKEAMACNCPVVATDVGDIRWLFGDEQGYYICSFDPKDVAEKIQLALVFAQKQGRTNGRERILKLGLDSSSVATKIIHLYNQLI